MKKLKLALIGCGKLSEVVGKAANDGILEEYELVGVFSRDENATNNFTNKFGGMACKSIEELMNLKADYTVEAATVEAVKEYSEKVISSGSNLIVLSIGAFADTGFYNKIKEIANKNNKKVYLPSGAIGGLDIIRTVALMGEVSSSINVKKPPRALLNTALYKDELQNLQGEELLFSGTASDAIKLLPTHVNVAIALSLASNGPEDTYIEISAMDNVVGDKFTIKVKGEGINIEVKIDPDSSLVAGWSVVSVLKNITSPIVF